MLDKEVKRWQSEPPDVSGKSNAAATGTEFSVDPSSVAEIRFAIIGASFSSAEKNTLATQTGYMGSNYLPDVWKKLLESNPNCLMRVSFHESFGTAFNAAMDLHPKRAVFIVPLVAGMKLPSNGATKKYESCIFIHHGQPGSLASNLVVLVHPNNRIVVRS
jgi:hypothetical protein